jgi:hypothetical protein
MANKRFTWSADEFNMITDLDAKPKGDIGGHEFHGNRWTGGLGGGGRSASAQTAMRKDLKKFHPKLAKTLGHSLHIENAKDFDENGIITHLRDLEKIPDSALVSMKDAGVEIYMGTGSVPGLDTMQKLDGVTPRGWPAGSTWNEVAGCFDTSGNGKVILGTGDHGSVSAAIHEMGHGYDQALGRVSHTDEFRAFHDEHYDKLDPYMQQGGRRGDAGCEEFFAESSAEIIMGHDYYGHSQLIYSQEYITYMKGVWNLP